MKDRIVANGRATLLKTPAEHTTFVAEVRARMRTLCWFGVLLLTGALFAGPEEFRVVSVRVRVRDGAGQLAKEAQVYAFSEYWRIRFPIGAYDNPGLATTDTHGQCVLRLPVGRYTFCAAPGWDALVGAPGRGFFLVLPGEEVQRDRDVVLAPNSTVQVVADLRRCLDLRSGRVMAFPEGWGATIAPLECAFAKEGVAEVATNTGSALTVYFHSVHKADLPVGHFLTASGVRSPARLAPNVPDERLGRIDLEVLDPEGAPGEAHVVLDYGQNADWRGVFFPVRARKRLFVAPGYVAVRQCELWYQQQVAVFRGCDLLADPGKPRTLRFGGPLQQPRIVFDNHSGSATEYWVDVRDRFGNPMLGSVHATASWDLAHDGQALGLKPTGGGFPLGCFGEVFPAEARPDFRLRLDLGPYGSQPELKGRFDGDALRYQPERTRLAHMDFYGPAELPTRAKALQSFVGQTYGTYVQLVGSGPDSFGAFVSLWGVAGGSWPNAPNAVGVANIHVLLHLPMAPEARGGLGAPTHVALHEMGHAFASSFPPHRAPWYDTITCETWPNQFRDEALRTWHGDSVGDAAVGRGCAYILRRLGDDREVAGIPALSRHHFIQSCIRKKYGWDVMRRFFQMSYTGDGSAPARLKAVGLTDVEAVASLYSFLCKDNLAWLYRVIKFSISDERVEQGVSALRE